MDQKTSDQLLRQDQLLQASALEPLEQETPAVPTATKQPSTVNIEVYAATSLPKRSLVSRIVWRSINFVRRYFLPISLVVGIMFGAVVPAPGRELAKTPLKYVCVSIIFLLQGLSLNSSDIAKAAGAVKGITYGMVAILGITPLVALAVIRIPFDPHEFAIGLAIFCCMPTTISSGVALAMDAGGNVALAIMLTVASNLLGIFLTPLMLQSYLAASETFSIDYLDIMGKLLLTVLLPLVVGHTIRYIKFLNVPKVMATGKELFGYVSSICLVLIPLMSVSKNAQTLRQVPGEMFFLLLFSAVMIHCMFLVCNVVVTYFLRLELEIQKTVVIMGSQKAVVMALSYLALISLPGEKGLMAVPAIVGHVSQVVIDSVLAALWKRNQGSRPTLLCCGTIGDPRGEKMEETMPADGPEDVVTTDWMVDSESVASPHSPSVTGRSP